MRSSASKDLRWPLLTSECLPNDPNDQFHTGVAPLLERIAANGYVIVYLTSRPMGLAAPTLALLASVREGTSRLPTGPLLLSPSRTFEALSRELVHKSVHEFKAACLCELAALWPPGNDPLVGNGPLVGGFGNKASDTRAYLAAGVPPSRIFIIDTSSCVRMPAAGSDAAMSAASAAAAAAMTADADSWAIDLANELAAAAIEEAIATAYGPAPTTAPVTRWLLSAKVADGVASALRLFGAAAAESSAATEESSEESSEEISEEIEDGADVGGDGAEGGGCAGAGRAGRPQRQRPAEERPARPHCAGGTIGGGGRGLGGCCSLRRSGGGGAGGGSGGGGGGGGGGGEPGFSRDGGRGSRAPHYLHRQLGGAEMEAENEAWRWDCRQRRLAVAAPCWMLGCLEVGRGKDEPLVVAALQQNARRGASLGWPAAEQLAHASVQVDDRKVGIEHQQPRSPK